MTVTNTIKDNDRLECISEFHLQYMREYIRWEEESSKKTLERFFLAQVLKQSCAVPINPRELQDILDELEKSRASRRRAYEILQEIRMVLKETAGVELPTPAQKTIDLDGRIVKDGVRKVVKDRQQALSDLSMRSRNTGSFLKLPEIERC